MVDSDGIKSADILRLYCINLSIYITPWSFALFVVNIQHIWFLCTEHLKCKVKYTYNYTPDTL